ncbi:MAG: TetR/AcrR family transcriptional regulator [Gordonia sp. (in: high G+C Gram-positive bacteria)]
MTDSDSDDETLRSYGGEAGTTRVERRRIALVDAALELLAQPESAPVTVRGILAQAGLTPRYFYESFTGVDDLVGAAYDEVITEIAQRALAAFDGGSEGRDKIERGVRAIVDVIDADPRKGRLIFADTVISPVLVARRAQAVTLFAQLTSETAAQTFDVPPGPESLAAAHFQVGGLGRVLASWLDGLIDVDREALIDVCVEMLLPKARD